ncbi:EF-hand domain-containing protein [Sphingomonas sp. R-74633]|uniref:EF-hand domain-containing protein n=1 Tax=Sphingomonas sp. R-74633 TaxID=2751188 RepID=UPI0015D145AC|nr:EF-hand domain-containing protein [Sphingomonas sp. R-74633]NYT39875.1 EF-hand domain-containing protein [Sphingomonas sp. R-74633]
MKTFLVAAALGATLLAAPAFAQDAPKHGAKMFDQMDADKDGVITKDEYNADIAARFAKIDTNKDGKISADERTAAGPRAGGRGMTDDMTLADMQAMAAKRFDRIDTNKDGKIDQAERDAMRARMGSRKAPPPGGSENN